MKEARSYSLSSIVFFSLSILSYVVSVHGNFSVVSETATLHLSPGLLVKNSPGSKPGTTMYCERYKIDGLPRLKYLWKIAHSLKVKVSYSNSSSPPSDLEVCFHRNVTIDIGMCPSGQWEKLAKGSWSRSMSPFDHKILDLRTTSSSLENALVSLEPHFFLYRVILLVTGIILMTLASFLSNSLVFYYSGAMAVGIILVIVIVLFQGMRLLPTGRKSSLAIFMYSSTVGLGVVLLKFVPQLLRSMCTQMGISEDMYKPVAVFLLAFVVLAGAWLGFWAVRKLVLAEDGSVDISTSVFVAWSIRILAAVMILQSSLDPILAVGALLCGILVSVASREFTKSRFLRHLYKKLLRAGKGKRRRSYITESSPIDDVYDEYTNGTQSPDSSKSLRYQSNKFSTSRYNSPIQGLSRTPPSQASNSNTFYSSYHSTPEKRKFSKEEWDNITHDYTKKALEELVSSPDFSKWAVTNAEKITLAPGKDTSSHRQRRWGLF